MIHIEASVFVQRSAEEVFAFAADVEQWTTWQTRFQEVERISGAGLELGTTVRTVSEGMGRSMESRSVLTELVPNRRYTFEGQSDTGHFVSRWTFEPDGEGSSVKSELEVTPGKGGVLVKLFEPWLVRVFQKRLADDLATLKLKLEV